MIALRPALPIAAYNFATFRQNWKGATFLYVISPLLFLGSMGVGLGGLVGRSRGAIDGVSYLQFLAPGLLATTAMQTATADMTYPIMTRLLWNRTYEALLNTPARVRDVITGELLWLTLRLLAVSALFYAVAVCFGAGRSPEAVLAIPVAVLTGLAFGVPVLAYTATTRGDNGFNVLNRFVVLPLFLLSGSFFPLTQLPLFLQAIAWALPVTHGVELCRALFLGRAGSAASVGHLVALLAFVTAGLFAAQRTMTRRLVV
ncbi:MAG TPA: ABC transporter permease [Candidatus Angelobacter sp.]|jgi:lipooligosaccharide transport system permease protein|nr:ABC transporter permease [Candidatus Angelobacter sp.]